MKKITNLTQGPRQLQYAPPVAADAKTVPAPKWINLAEGGTTGATVEVDDDTWKALQANPLIKAVLGDSNQFRVV